MMPPHNVLLNASEQPREELRRKERESPTEHDPRDLSFRSRFAEHKKESPDDDRHERERPSERTSKRCGEIAGSAFPRRLRERHRGNPEDGRGGDEARAPNQRAYGVP